VESSFGGPIWLLVGRGARPKSRSDCSRAPASPSWSGFDTAVSTGDTKLQGRPTLTRAVHKSGRKLYVEMSFAIIRDDADGKLLGAVAMARHVTERVERERSEIREC
jgi:hypothetical protein